MPRVTFVKKAQKSVKGTDIKKGDSYYWWKFRYGPKRTSKTQPRQSQLTQSDFLGQLYSIQEEIEDLDADDTLPDAVQDIAQRLHDLAGECEEKKSNMPDSLQEGDTGQLLESRAQACNSSADELEGLDLSEWAEDDDETKTARKEDPDAEPVNAEGQTEQEYWEEKLEEVQGVSIEEGG